SPGGNISQVSPGERAKMESPLLNEVVDSARRHRYDENLVTAFVSVQVELWLIENPTTGARIVINRQEFETIFGDDPPEQLTSVGGAPANAPIVLPRRSEIAARTSEQYEDGETVEFLQSLPSWQDLPTADDRDEWQLVGQVVSSDRLLNVNSGESVYFGLAKAIVGTDAELQAFFGATSLKRYDESWSEGLVRLLISWPVRLILIALFLVGLFIELAAPGTGVFGIVAACALALLIGAPALAGMAQWWDILLIIAGIGLVLVELFIVPGFGVAGLAGAACLLIGMVGTFVSGDIGSIQGQDQIVKGLITTLTGLFAGGIGMWLASKWFHQFPLFRRFILTAGTDHTGGVGSVGIVESLTVPQRALDDGDEGIASTDLRPSGRATFDGRLVDVQSVGSFIEKGTAVRVVRVGRFIIEVEAIQDSSTP
ncbi:MAG: NfeD family protein, partial [Planctomycetota bacterium]